MTSTIKADAIEAATGTNTDLTLTGKGSGVVNLEAGSKLGGTALTSTFNAYVAPSTSGNVLTSNGSAWTSAAAPGGAWEFVSTTTCAGATSYSVLEGNVSADYDYFISMSQIKFSADPAARYPQLQYGTGVGPTYQTTGYLGNNAVFSAAATLNETMSPTTAIALGAPGTYQFGGTTANEFANIEILLLNPEAVNYTFADVRWHGPQSNGVPFQGFVSAWRSTAEAHTGFKIFVDGAKTMDSGFIITYRRKRTA